LGLIGSLLGIAALSMGYYHEPNAATLVEQAMNNIPTTLETQNLPNEDKEKEKVNLQDSPISTYSIYIYASFFLAEIICAIFSTLLIVGAVKGRRNFLLPWLIYILIVMVGTTAAFIMSVIMLDTLYGVSILVVGILQLLFLIWYWLVVFSLFQELRERDQMIINSPAEMKRLTSQC